MYDVNFGGIEQMTKRLTIALVAVALFVLLAVMPVSAVNYPVGANISQGATVFIGEQGLNLTEAQIANYVADPWIGQGLNPVAARQNAALSEGMYIGWWASAAQLGTTAPTTKILLTTRNRTFTVAPADFVGYTGNWYVVNSTNSLAMTPAFMSVADPTIDVKVWDFAQAADVSGKSVVQGTFLGFRVDTNMYNALIKTQRDFVVGSRSFQQYLEGSNRVFNDGFIDIKVKDESGTTLTRLYNGSVQGGDAATQWANNLTQQNVSFQPWYWGTAPSTLNPMGGVAGDNGQVLVNMTAAPANWSTGAIDINGQYNYPAGTYTVTAESNLNNMQENYKNAGASYTGKTISQAYTVTLVSDTVKIEANKDSVVRSKPFSVTITGRPAAFYTLWVKGTSTMTGGYDDQPPMIVRNQAGVAFDIDNSAAAAISDQASFAPGRAGNYTFQNGGGTATDIVYFDVCNGGTTAINKQKVGNGTFLYANVTLSSAGTRVVEFTTTNWTKAQKYTIHVERQFDGTVMANTIALYGTGSYKSDEVDVKVEKGAVTIVAAGDQSYYLGEEIKFSGTNTESYTTYLFIIGPNLQTDGSQIQSQDPRNNAVTNLQASTFQTATVAGDNTWSYKWGTSNYALDAGTYTVYAVSQPNNKANLQRAAYGTVSIIIKKPFVSATASQSTVAKGDKIFITGTAEGKPSKGVQIWVLGKNKAILANEAVNADSSFKYELRGTETASWYPGQYFVVVQHPMQNNQFDVYLRSNTVGAVGYGQVWNRMLNRANDANGAQVFAVLGAGSLQGSDAAEALVQAINDPNVDDTYTKLQFLVEEPVIRVDAIGDKHVGDKFTITAQTNLAVDDEVLVQVYSSSFKPTQKSQSGEFSGATGTVKVTKGDGGMNKVSFDVDSSTFKPDEYLVTETGVIVVATGTALFNVLEGAAPTAVPTAVVTTAAPTAVATTVPPTTVAPTPTPTKSPGYGALIALIGLGAVAFIVVRRH
jgi:PGF-CTERM protein